MQREGVTQAARQSPPLPGQRTLSECTFPLPRGKPQGGRFSVPLAGGSGFA